MSCLSARFASKLCAPLLFLIAHLRVPAALVPIGLLADIFIIVPCSLCPCSFTDVPFYVQVPHINKAVMQNFCLSLQDTRLMKSAGTSSISVALRSVVVAIFGLVLMFITSVLLTALTLAILPILLLSFRWFAIVNKKYTAEQLSASAEASTVAEECFGSIRTVSGPFLVITVCRTCIQHWHLQCMCSNSIQFGGSGCLSHAAVHQPHEPMSSWMEIPLKEEFPISP